jgi:VIT1/CCC1 family predicted Fe2+/Mn2+ transporter
VTRQALRNLLRWGGLAIAIIGYVFGRSVHTVSGAHAARVLLWIGLAMIVSGIVVRWFVSEP